MRYLITLAGLVFSVSTLHADTILLLTDEGVIELKSDSPITVSKLPSDRVIDVRGITPNPNPDPPPPDPNPTTTRARVKNWAIAINDPTNAQAHAAVFKEIAAGDIASIQQALDLIRGYVGLSMSGDWKTDFGDRVVAEYKTLTDADKLETVAQATQFIVDVSEGLTDSIQGAGLLPLTPEKIAAIRTIVTELFKPPPRDALAIVQALFVLFGSGNELGMINEDDVYPDVVKLSRRLAIDLRLDNTKQVISNYKRGILALDIMPLDAATKMVKSINQNTDYNLRKWSDWGVSINKEWRERVRTKEQARKFYRSIQFSLQNLPYDGAMIVSQSERRAAA